MLTSRAIELAGSAKALAELLAITRGAITHWGANVPQCRVYQLRLLRRSGSSQHEHSLRRANLGAL